MLFAKSSRPKFSSLKLSCFFALAMGLAVFGGKNVQASENSLIDAFAPKTYQKQGFLPRHFSDQFFAPTTQGEYFLEFEKEQRGSFAFVFLNGEKIFGASDFLGPKKLIRARVTVAPTNTLTVIVFGFPGAKVSGRVWGLVPSAQIPPYQRNPAKKIVLFDELFQNGPGANPELRSIENPWPEGFFEWTLDNRVQGSPSGFVRVNQRTVFKPSDFQSGLASAPVDRESQNTLKVTLLGQGGQSRIQFLAYVPVPKARFPKVSRQVSESKNKVSVVVKLNEKAPVDISIPFLVSGSATNPDDYTVTASPLIIPAGKKKGKIVIDLNDDALVENNEAVVLTLLEPEKACLGNKKVFTLTIVDNDNQPNLPTVSLDQASLTVSEDQGSVTVTAQLSAASASDVTVPFQFSGSAQSPSDYLASASPLVIPAGALSASLSLTIVDDSVYEPSEDLVLTLGTPTNATLGSPSQFELTVNDNEALPTVAFSVASSSVNESAGTAQVTAVLSGLSSETVSVPLGFAGTAQNPSDYSGSPMMFSFAPGSNTATLTVTVIDDALDENDESVQISMGAPMNAQLGLPNQHVLVIVDNDSPPSIAFTVASQSINEGSGVVTVTAELSGPSGLPISASLSFAGSAESPGDYSASASLLSFAPGQESASVNLTLVDDALNELTETILVSLSSPSNASLGSPNTQTISIVDNDALVVSFVQGSSAVSEGGGLAQVGVQLSVLSSVPVTIPFTASGTASSGADFNLSSASLTIPAGTNSGFIEITILEDSLDEEDELVVLQLGSPSVGSLGAPVVHSLSILDNDAAPTVSIGPVNPSVSEAGGNFSFTVSLSAASEKSISVPFSLSGSASQPADYTVNGGPLQFAPGVTSQSIVINLIDDALDEESETVLVTLGTPSNASLGTVDRSSLTLLDNDNPPSLSFAVASQSVAEGAGPVTVVVNLSEPSGLSVSGTLSFAGTASSSEDYTASASAFTISPGQTSASVALTIVDDQVYEEAETIVLGFATLNNATVGAVSAQTVTVTDNEALPIVRFAVASQSAAEDVGSVQVTVQLSGPSALTTTVPLTFGGSASNPEDYTAPNLVTFAPGALSQEITVTVIDDLLDENNETVSIQLGAPVNAALGTPSLFQLSIIDNDGAPSLSFQVAAQSVPENQGTVNVALQLSEASSLPVTVPFSVTGSAANPGDFTLSASPLTIPAGAVSAVISVTINNDVIDELDETVILTLGTPSQATVGAIGTHTLTILDDDDGPTVSFLSPSQSANENSGVLSIPVGLSGPSGRAISVPFTVQGSAGPQDVSVSSSPLNFAPGVTEVNIQVTITDDARDEFDETVLLTLGAPSNASLGTELLHTLTVLDNDAEPTVAFTEASSSAAESSATVTVTASLSVSSGKEVTVPLLLSGSASNPQDYSLSANAIVIPAGFGSASVTLTIVNDTLDEPNESIIVTQGALVNATPGFITSFTHTIIDDDEPSVVVSPVSQSVLESLGVASFSVTLSNPSTVDISVPLSVSGTAGAGDATILTGPVLIPAGDLTALVDIQLIDDNEEEASETVIVSLGTPVGAVLGSETVHTLTILDDDGLASFDLSLTTAAAGSVLIGSENDLRIEAKTLGGRTYEGFTGFVEILSSDGLLPLHQLIVEFIADDRGVFVLKDLASFYSVGSITVTARSLENDQIQGLLAVNTVIDRPAIQPAPEVNTEQEAVLIEGVSFPGGVVELVVDGQVVATVNAGADGRFSFSQSFALGNHTVFVRSENPSNPGVFVEGEPRLISVNPARLLSSSPAHLDEDVAITRETILRFNTPLDPSTIDSSSIFAEFGGQLLPGRLNLSPDQKTVTLFYNDPLPANARVRVTYDGDLLRRVTGTAIDGDGDGQPGGAGVIDFDTLSLTLVPGTAVCGRVFASELATAPGGGSVNQPLEGVRITVDGAETTLFTTTDSNGNFRLEPAPAGRFFVHIDGRTATAAIPTGAYYPFVGKAWTSIPEEEVNIGEVYLPLIGAGTLQTVSATTETTIEFTAQVLNDFPELNGVQIMVPADSLYADDGSRGGQVGISPVAPDRLPGELPQGLDFSVVITVQTNGATNFDIPAPVRFPNLDNLPPGAKTALWSFNHDTGQFEVVGSMTVSADGLYVVSDPGVGILAPGWHGSAPGVPVVGGEIRDDPPPTKSVASSTSDQEAADGDCVSSATCETGTGVFLHNGEKSFSCVDFAIPGRGLSFAFTRTYRSQLDYDGPLGCGWTFNFNEYLDIKPNGDVTRVNGRGHIDEWVLDSNGNYSPPLGYFSTLKRDFANNYVLRERSGFQRFYRSDGLLYKYLDRHGNSMLFDYDENGNLDTVVDSYGREYDFVFETAPDGAERLSKVVDFIGREVKYRYDSQGDLVEVQSPEVEHADGTIASRVSRYTYSQGFADPRLNHNILSATAPEEVATGGAPYMEWTYGTDPGDPVTFDRVLTERMGGTNASGVVAGGTMSIQYEMLNENEPMGQVDLPRGQATITEPNGNIRVYQINELQHHIVTKRLTRGLRVVEPAKYVTRSFFNTDGLLTRRVFPEGNEVLYSYDSGSRAAQRNLVEIRSKADSTRGGGEDIVTTMTYEPLYNQILTITDPRGLSSSFVPPLGTPSASRYTSQFFYDYQEGTGPVEQAIEFGIDLTVVPRGLGDLNGDGRVDQVFGNPVRSKAPNVTLRPDSKLALGMGSTSQEIFSEIQWNDRGQVIATIDSEGNVTEFRRYPENDPDGDGRLTNALIFNDISSAETGYLAQVIVDARSSPRRSTVSAPAQITTEMTYDPVGNMTSVLNPRGVRSEAEYNVLNEVVRVFRGTELSEAVARGQLLTSEAPLRYEARLFYDRNGRVVKTELENRDGNTPGVGAFIEATTVYDILSNSVSSTVEVDATKSLTWTQRYDENQLPVLSTAPEGNQSQVSYDERNLVFTVTSGFGSPEASTITVNYDLNGNRVEVIDAEDNDGDGQGEKTTVVYDGFDRVKEIVDALGNRALVTYDIASQVVRQQVFGHPAGQPGGANVLLSDVRMSHDELGRVYQSDAALFLSNGFSPSRAVSLQDENSDGFVTAFAEFDKLSRLVFATEDDGQCSEMRYDGVSRVIETLDARGNRQTVSYDQNSNAVSVTSFELPSSDARVSAVPAEAFTTRYVYDQFDRLVRATDNVGQTARFSYDSRDNLVERSDSRGSLVADPLNLFPGAGQSGQINEAGNIVRYFYDGIDRMVLQRQVLTETGLGGGAVDTSNVHNPDGFIDLQYEYDDNSRLLAIVDDNGNRTSYGYDALNRKVRQQNADGKEYTLSYDRDSNVIQSTDPNGTVVTNSFDALHRVTQTSYSNASGVLGVTLCQFSYDGLSRLTSCSDNNGSIGATQTVVNVYDSLSRLLEQQQNGQAISNVFSGDGKRLQCVYPGGRTLTASFDELDRRRSVSDSGGVIAECLYIGPGARELKRLNGNGTSLTFLNDGDSQNIGYDGVQRITKLRHKLPGGQDFIDREFEYNRASMRTRDRRNDDSGQENEYSYDSVHRLISSRYDQNGTGGVQRDLGQQRFTFDGVGNRRDVEETRQSQGVNNEVYAVNEMNEYSSVSGVTRNHDDNGNLIDDGNLLYSYDAKDRLVRVFNKGSGNLVADYLYDCGNRRTKKIVYSQVNPGQVEKETNFFYDGWEVCEEQSSTGQTEITYVYGNGIDEIVEFSRTANHPLGAGQFYCHQDIQKNVVAVTDASGALVEKTFYDAYGAPLDSNKQPISLSAVGNPYGFQGRRLDAETGLYYFRHRYYSPETGRFIQRDPVWDPDNVGNQYSFANNGVINGMDPLGLDWTDYIPDTDDLKKGFKAGGYALLHAATGAFEKETKEAQKACGMGAKERKLHNLGATITVTAAATATGLKGGQMLASGVQASRAATMSTFVIEGAAEYTAAEIAAPTLASASLPYLTGAGAAGMQASIRNLGAAKTIDEASSAIESSHASLIILFPGSGCPNANRQFRVRTVTRGRAFEGIGPGPNVTAEEVSYWARVTTEVAANLGVDHYLNPQDFETARGGFNSLGNSGGQNWIENNAIRIEVHSTVLENSGARALPQAPQAMIELWENMTPRERIATILIHESIEGEFNLWRSRNGVKLKIHQEACLSETGRFRDSAEVTNRVSRLLRLRAESSWDRDRD